MRFLRLVFGVCLAVALSMPRHSQADILGVPFRITDSVVRIDESTGVATAIGPAGFGALNSLAADSSATLYTAVDSSFGSPLVTIDSGTGAGTQVAALNFGIVRPDIRGLAFSPGDVLFAINNTGPIGESNPDDLFTINASTGVGTLIGATGLSGLQGLDFSPDGALYGWDVFIGLVTIDATTGIASDVNPAVGGTASIQSIVFAPDGTLYGARDSLFTINVATGSWALVGSGGYADLRGIEFVSAVPEPSGLALLSLGLAGLGFWRRKIKYRD